MQQAPSAFRRWIAALVVVLLVVLVWKIIDWRMQPPPPPAPAVSLP
jgi:hypothetical protein